MKVTSRRLLACLLVLSFAGCTTAGLFRVRSSADEPTNAFIRVRYRDAWFYIDDSDPSSKSTFTLLDTLFQLQAGGAQGGVPLLTLPVGGQ